MLSINDERFESIDNKAIADAVTKAAEAEGAKIIIFAHNNEGKAIAPRVAIKLDAGMISGVTGLPVSYDPFTVKSFCKCSN